jgi:hypothetical protein
MGIHDCLVRGKGGKMGIFLKLGPGLALWEQVQHTDGLGSSAGCFVAVDALRRVG